MSIINDQGIVNLSSNSLSVPSPGECDLNKACTMTDKLYRLLHFGSFFLTKWLALRVGGRRFQSIKFFIPRRPGPQANRADVNQLPYPHKRHQNLSNREHLALHSLASNRRIISKPADKGSSTVIMNTCDWIHEAMKQLSNTNFYKPGDQQIDKIIYDVTITLKIMRLNKEIEKKYLPIYSLTRGIQDTFVCCQKFTKVLQVDISSQPLGTPEKKSRNSWIFVSYNPTFLLLLSHPTSRHGPFPLIQKTFQTLFWLCMMLHHSTWTSPSLRLS